MKLKSYHFFVQFRLFISLFGSFLKKLPYQIYFDFVDCSEFVLTQFNWTLMKCDLVVDSNQHPSLEVHNTKYNLDNFNP